MIKSLGILGAGTMGAGIAQVAALKKIDVYLYDINDTLLRQGTERIRADYKRGIQKGKLTSEEMMMALDHIKSRTNLNDLGHCEFIIEAVVEDVRVKKDLFKRLDEHVRPTTTLATNTSSISVTAIASAIKKPERVVGMHFFNPAHIMKLVEVVKGHLTDEETAQKTFELAQFLGKTPVMVKDTPGFIVNRVARPFYGEALRLFGENVATHEQIDRLTRTVGGFAMGPFELMDLIGIDVNLSVTQSMYDQYFGEPRYRPHRIHQQMVQAGKLGRKSNEGFYKYEKQ
jgi:3-hydroxybutyryl-CoA dehydrogenase